MIVVGAAAGVAVTPLDHGALLLPGLDPAAREPAPARRAARPPPEPLAALPRRGAGRRRDLPHVPGQRDGDAADRGAVPGAALRARRASCSAWARWRSSTRSWRCCWCCSGRRCWRSASGSRGGCASRFRRAREATSGAHLAHPGDPRGHPGDQGLRRRARRAAALRGGEPRRLRRRLRRAQPPRDLPGDRCSGWRARRWPRAGAFAALRTWRGDGIAVAALGFTVWNLGLFNYAKARFGDGAGSLRAAVPHLGPGPGHRDRPRPRVRDARSRARGARRAGRGPAAAGAPRRALPRRALPLRGGPPRPRGRRLRGARRHASRRSSARPARARPR